MPLVSTGAGAIYNGFFKVRHVSNTAEFEHRCLALAQLAAAQHDADGAFSNDTMLVVRINKLPSGTMASSMHCGDHRDQLGETAVLKVVGVDLLLSFYPAALYFRMGRAGLGSCMQHGPSCSLMYVLATC